MNLPHMYELMNSAHEQRHELLGSYADRQVRLMASAGLVDATLDSGKEGSFTVINRVTATGRSFLRAFKNIPMATPAILPFSQLDLGFR